MALLALAFSAAEPTCADELPAAPPAYRTTERSDFSVYRDGKYLGHAYRETRGSIAPVGPDSDSVGAYVYEGTFYILEETLRDMRSAACGVDRSVESRFSTAPGGVMRFSADSGFPSLRGVPPRGIPGRGLPAMPDGALDPGDAWTAAGERSVEIEGSARPIVIPLFAEYRYVGPAEYRGRPAIKLSGKFATRYRPTAKGDPLVGASGSHELEIYIDEVDLSPLFIRDRFDETFSLSAGGSLRRSGFNLLFYEGSAPLDRGATILSLREAKAVPGGTEPRGGGAGGAAAGMAASARPQAETAGGAAGTSSGAEPASASTVGEAERAAPPGAGPGPLIAGGEPGLDELAAGAAGGALGSAGVELGESEAGVVLRVRDLRFVADSDAILQSELWRLDAIAAALKTVPGRRFLIEGHSASVGKALGELELSERRASRVAAELVARGIDPGLIMYRGLGSSRPVAPNDTEAGRALNRRVEITILDY